MYQKNELKNLIYIQENKPCNEQTVKGLFRSVIEPILEINSEGLVILRLEDKSKLEFKSILKRLEYSNAKIFDFSDISLNKTFENILKNKIWNKTEFVYVLSERFGACLIFDYEEVDFENFAQYYLIYNSKKLTDAFDIINSNSKVDLNEYKTKWTPDRRDNDLLNLSIKKVVENFNEMNQEVLISKVENQILEESENLVSRLNFLQTKTGYISHELRNLLSICNLYLNIIEKQESQIIIKDKEAEKSILNARECIKKTFKMVNNLLLDFKSLRNTELKEYKLFDLTELSLELTKVYSNGKEITFKNNVQNEINVLIDEDKFLTVLINLIKNAVESIEKKGEIVIDAKIDEKNVKISVSNNGLPISKDIQNKLFKKGFTTKSTGSGLGLAICKKTLEEQFAQLRLVKSDKISTEFEITTLKGV